MSDTSRTPSAIVNPRLALLDLVARWIDLNSLTVFDVWWFVIRSQLCEMMLFDDAIMERRDFEDDVCRVVGLGVQLRVNGNANAIDLVDISDVIIIVATARAGAMGDINSIREWLARWLF